MPRIFFGLEHQLALLRREAAVVGAAVVRHGVAGVALARVESAAQPIERGVAVLARFEERVERGDAGAAHRLVGADRDRLQAEALGAAAASASVSGIVVQFGLATSRTESSTRAG